MQGQVQGFYDSNALVYDQEQSEFSFVRIPEWEIATSALKKVAERSHSVLEIGAGTGRFTLEVAPLVRQITAVDISRNMLDRLSQKAKEKGITNVKQVCGNFMEIPFDEKFDLIMSFSSIEYILDTKGLFAKIGELLAPGGHLILTTAHDTYFRWWGRMGNYFRQGIFMEAYSKKRMRRLLTDNGLEAVEMKDLCLKNIFIKGILLFVYAKK